MRNRLRLPASAVALAAVALSLFSCSGPKKASDSPAAAPETSAAPKARDLTLDPAQRQKIRLEKVAFTSFRRTIETTGTVAFDQNRSTQVLAPISGPVAKIQVEVGARVGRGQALATVASPDFAADVSALRKAEALAKNARRVADLDQQLWKNDAIARRDMEQAETDAVSAEADRDTALQQLRDLGVDAKTVGEIQQNKSTYGAGGLIRSPLSGTVVEKLITPGQLLQAGTTPCFTVADLSTVWVMANIFETDLPFVAPGDTARVITGGGGGPGGPGVPIMGRVDYISALVDPTTRAIAVRIVAPNPQEALKRDLYVNVEIQSSRERKGLLVPVSAILRDDENLPFVFVSMADGTFPRRRVEIGSRMGDRQEITSGLKEGETVVAEGGLFLQTAGGS